MEQETVLVVEQRGNSCRVIHYRKVDDKRVFTKHSIRKGNRIGNRKARFMF